jgi:hypothetical protein
MERGAGMPMTRAQLRRAAIIAQCRAAKDKPLERRRVRSFMEPITRAFALISQGVVEVDDNDTPITRLPHNDNWEALDACIEGFVCAMARLLPDIDLDPLRYVASDLRKGKLMTVKKAQSAWQTLRIIEDRMTKCTWNEVSRAVDTTRIEIELERLGIKEAA